MANSTWRRADSGRVLRAFEGSALERVLHESPDWDRVESDADADDHGEKPDPRMRMSRTKLDEMATEAGVPDPDQLDSKADVIAAIDAAADGNVNTGGTP